MTKKASKKSSETGLAWGVGAGLTAALAAAGYYLYGSKDAPKNRKKVRGWMLKMKGEVLEKMEKMKDINEDSYQQLVDTVSTKYIKLKDVENDEVEAIKKDLKKHWKNIKKELNAVVKEKKSK